MCIRDSHRNPDQAVGGGRDQLHRKQRSGLGAVFDDHRLQPGRLAELLAGTFAVAFDKYAVSSTHLDVYKRQAISWRMMPSSIGSDDIEITAATMPESISPTCPIWL